MQRSLDVRKSGAAKQTDDDDGVEVPRDWKHERQQPVKAPVADGDMCTDTAKRSLPPGNDRAEPSGMRVGGRRPCRKGRRHQLVTAVSALEASDSTSPEIHVQEWMPDPPATRLSASYEWVEMWAAKHESIRQAVAWSIEGSNNGHRWKPQKMVRGVPLSLISDDCRDRSTMDVLKDSDFHMIFDIARPEPAGPLPAMAGEWRRGGASAAGR